MDNTKTYAKITASNSSAFSAIVTSEATIGGNNTVYILTGYGSGTTARNSVTHIGGNNPSANIWNISGNYFYAMLTDKQISRIYIENLGTSSLSVSFVNTL